VRGLISWGVCLLFECEGINGCIERVKIERFFYLGVMIFRVSDINLCYLILVGALNDCKHEVNYYVEISFYILIS
jgi:hypothetical protein